VIGLLLAALLNAPSMDSQVVLERYAARLLHHEDPKVLIFSYAISQAGPHDIDQTHRIYRSGDLVRDETLTSDGVRAKAIRIARYRNRYTLEGLAPRLTEYAFLFERAVRSGKSLSYQYRAVPLAPGAAFVVNGITIDLKTFLPTLIRFHAASGGVAGSGSIAFARAGNYWVPMSVAIDATVRGKPAREHISFSSYQFPRSLPISTFQGPKPLPTPALPTF
jgi:hypothetical protein